MIILPLLLLTILVPAAAGVDLQGVAVALRGFHRVIPAGAPAHPAFQKMLDNTFVRRGQGSGDQRGNKFSPPPGACCQCLQDGSSLHNLHLHWKE